MILSVAAPRFPVAFVAVAARGGGGPPYLSLPKMNVTEKKKKNKAATSAVVDVAVIAVVTIWRAQVPDKNYW